MNATDVSSIIKKKWEAKCQNNLKRTRACQHRFFPIWRDSKCVGGICCLVGSIIRVPVFGFGFRFGPAAYSEHQTLKWWKPFFGSEVSRKKRRDDGDALFLGIWEGSRGPWCSFLCCGQSPGNGEQYHEDGVIIDEFGRHQIWRSELSLGYACDTLVSCEVKEIFFMRISFKRSEFLFVMIYYFSNLRWLWNPIRLDEKRFKKGNLFHDWNKREKNKTKI